MSDGEELQGQIYDMAGEMYEDQFALIVIGETEPCDETSVEVHAAGTAILPDCCTPDMLTTAIVELMRKEPVVADILRSAVRRYDEIQMPPRICLN